MLMETDREKSYWVVDKFAEEMNGCMITADQEGEIDSIQIIRNRLTKIEQNFFKSVGMLKITWDFGLRLSKWLSNYVYNNDVNLYYDLVISKHIDEWPINILNVQGCKWYEIDDINDLRKAEELFS